MILEIIGAITTVVVLFFAVMQVLARMLNLKKPSDNASDLTDKMPKLAPIPIPTKSQPTHLHKIVAYVTEVRQWQVIENWEYEFDGRTYVIPKGFVFDGASIPRPLWGILSPIGLLLVPGLIHDYGYRYDYVWIRSDDSENGYQKVDAGMGQKHWDKVFYEVGKEVNGLSVLNWLAWIALVLGGKAAWNANRKRNDEEIHPLQLETEPAG
jgi:hypothetical protein